MLSLSRSYHQLQGKDLSAEVSVGLSVFVGLGVFVGASVDTCICVGKLVDVSVGAENVAGFVYMPARRSTPRDNKATPRFPSLLHNQMTRASVAGFDTGT